MYTIYVKKQYTEPKLFDSGGNLDKRWYVYFSFRNPETGTMIRQTPIFTGIAPTQEPSRPAGSGPDWLGKSVVTDLLAVF